MPAQDVVLEELLDAVGALVQVHARHDSPYGGGRGVLLRHHGGVEGTRPLLGELRYPRRGLVFAAGGEGASELEEAGVYLAAWFCGGVDAPARGDGGEGFGPGVGVDGGLEDDLWEAGVQADEVLDCVVAEEVVAEDGEGVVVEPGVWVCCFVDEGAGEGFQGEGFGEVEAGVEGGEFGGFAGADGGRGGEDLQVEVSR